MGIFVKVDNNPNDSYLAYATGCKLD